MRVLDAKSWKVDLRAPLGVKIPLGIAQRSIPNNLRLRYFDPIYVKFVLEGRIEQHIVSQSGGNPNVRPISSGRRSEALAELNTFSKRGALKGLGDIDLLQICDISRQYKSKPGYVLLGQTLDRGLAEVLSHQHFFIESRSVVGGDPRAREELVEALLFMHSKPFAEQDERSRSIRPRFVEFYEALVEAVS